MSVGRYFCVALPFILTVASILCMLIAGLTGVVDGNDNLYMFRVNTSDFSINSQEILDMINGSGDWSNTVENIQNDFGKRDVAEVAERVHTRQTSLSDIDLSQFDGLNIQDVLNELANSGINITASDLNLPELYDVTLWGYCMTLQNNTRRCTEPEFDWASKHVTTDIIDQFSDIAGLADINITIPDAVDQSIVLFQEVTKWTQIVYLIAMVALALELIVGLFTACSRAISCVTWVISGFATLCVIAAAALMTATATIVVGTVEATGDAYGVAASFNTSFLAVIWIGAAFALAASLFWLFSVCCCKPEHRPHKTKHQDPEKFPPPVSRSGSAYHQIGADQHHGYAPQNTGYTYGVPQRGGSRSDMAYEPYSHNH